MPAVVPKNKHGAVPVKSQTEGPINASLEDASMTLYGVGAEPRVSRIAH